MNDQQRTFVRSQRAFREYAIRSSSSQFLKEQRLRWYPEWKKIVPRDVLLDPVSILHWYLGDGSLCVHRGYVKGAKFCALAFTDDERIFLGDGLRKLGFSV